MKSRKTICGVHVSVRMKVNEYYLCRPLSSKVAWKEAPSQVKIGGMILGIPKEIKAQEYRVALTPEAVGHLVRGGHRVLVQAGAGKGCGYSDQEFRDNGAVILSSAAAVWKGAELLLKVKEPFPKEYSFFRPGL